VPGKPHYDRDAARAKRKAQAERRRLLVERAKAMELLEKLERQASAHAAEFLNSPNLKVWGYKPTGHSMAHLFAELSDGTKRPLCGQAIDQRAVAMVITATRQGDCARCNQTAQVILQRRLPQLPA